MLDYKNTQFKEEIQDLIMSEKWTLIKSIYTDIRDEAMKGLLAVMDGGSFHRMQGRIEGMDILISRIELLAKPEALEWVTDTQEYILNARKS